jgi:hypothetical protein
MCLCQAYTFLYIGCNRTWYTTLKIYCDQTNSNITKQFLTERFLTLQVFYKCSIWLPLVMRQTSRKYSNFSHSLSKKVTSIRAMVLTILWRSSWRSTGMVVCTHYPSRIPKMKSPWVSEWVIWVTMECSRQDLSTFLWTSTTWCGFCDP